MCETTENILNYTSVGSIGWSKETMQNTSTLRIINHFGVPILMGAGGLLSMILIAHFLRNGDFPMWEISQHQVLNFTFTMQVMVLPISFVVLVLLYRYNRENFKIFFKLAESHGETESKEQTHWRMTGPLIAIMFTLGTILFSSVVVTSQNGVINESFYKLIPMVLLLAATNAWSEEIFSRFAIVAGLYGKVKPIIICWISAILFGLPHFFGTPSGIFGVVMSGLLGWLLAKSVIETKGMGWALLIHFLQDIVIFGAGAMIMAGQQH